MPEQPKREYLGDGVYAEFDGYQVWIWTSNGMQDSDHIALEPEVMQALVAFYTRSKGKAG